MPRATLTLALAASLATGVAPATGCLTCHPSAGAGHGPGHAFAASDCRPCHAGDPSSAERETAHLGLVAFPGQLDNAARTCGACHPAQLRGVLSNPMTTLRGLIDTTRRVIEEAPGAPAQPAARHAESPERAAGIVGLGASPADTLLRKLCVGCHLGRAKVRHAHDPVRDRGGGCLACHVNAYPSGAHPEVSARVEDARCFGCHSRSSRIALSYAGLAEVDEGAAPGAEPGTLGRLSDGRLVERRPGDRHHRAGLACIDCHTGAELMSLVPPAPAPPAAPGGLEAAPPASSPGPRPGGVRCEDCHGPGRAVAAPAELSAWQRARLRPAALGSAPQRPVVLTGRAGVPLAGLELGEGETYLHRRIAGGRVVVPPYRAEDHPVAGVHARVACETCHSQWAPRCYGCHLTYDPDSRQWDHLAGAETPGRWVERRWDTRNGPPLLGAGGDGRIAPFVPGMILSVEHPAWGPARLRRLFARVAPHTTGPARTCASCHRSAEALGLGAGRLERRAGGWALAPAGAALADGLPADAWTDLDGARGGEATAPGDRPLDPQTRRRMLEAGLGEPSGRPD